VQPTLSRILVQRESISCCAAAAAEKQKTQSNNKDNKNGFMTCPKSPKAIQNRNATRNRGQSHYGPHQPDICGATADVR